MGYLRAFFRIAWIGITMGSYLLAYFIAGIWRKPTLERGFALRQAWARLGTRILGIQVEKTGEVPEKPVLFVVNHRSLVDPMIIAPYCNAFVLAKSEVSKYPILGKGAEATGVVFVERENKDSRQAARDAIEKTLKRGENVMVFPEGTVTTYKHTKEFRMGAFIVAANMNIPVIPVILEYRDQKDLWKRNSMILQFFNQFNVAKTYTKLHFGNKITHQDPSELMTLTQTYINQKLDEMHVHWSNMKFEVPQEPEAKAGLA